MSQITGKEALMRIFKQEKVEYVFGIPGATEVHFMDAMEDHPEIKYILCLHEVVSVGMAEGYARISGKPGVLNLHTNTGLGASLPLLSNARDGGVPIIVTAGQQDTRLMAQEPALGGELVRIAGPFTKWSTEIAHAADIPLVMRRAFKMALQPPTGPVFVSLPQDVLANTLDYEYTPVPPLFTKLRPDAEAIKIAADLLSRARNPVIIVQDGVTKNDALNEVVKLAELTGARVYQPWMSDVNFPVHHPLYMGDLGVNSLKCREIFEASDVVIGIGALLFSQPVYFTKALLPSHVKLIQIDDNPWQISKNFPAAAGIQGNIQVSVAELISDLEGKLSKEAREAAARRKELISGEKRKLMDALQEQAAKEKDSVPVSATRLMREIKDAIPPGTRIVDDCWTYSGTLRSMLGFSEPLSYMRSRNGGSIGGGLPTALGVKLASPERPVVCVAGDGSSMWSIQTFWTAAHYNIPVTFIVCANGIYCQVRVMKSLVLGEKAKGRNLGTDLCEPRIDFCKLAEGMGLMAQRVEKPGQLHSALRTALDSNRPNVLEVSMKSII